MYDIYDIQTEIILIYFFKSGLECLEDLIVPMCSDLQQLICGAVPAHLRNVGMWGNCSAALVLPAGPCICRTGAG